jgi:hypothetical protein
MRSAFSEGILGSIRFPTPEHGRLIRKAIARFEPDVRVKAMLLTNSLARNAGDRFSDLDFAVFVSDGDLAKYKAIANELRFASPDVEVHMAATTVHFVARDMDVNDLDGFEIRIGNFLAHPLLLFDRDGDWHSARARYLPYYDEDLADARARRFGELVRRQIEYGRVAVDRGLAFEAVQRIVQALSLFFACLFVERRTYPVDYQKRIEQQVVDWLQLPEVVAQATGILSFDGKNIHTLGHAIDRMQSLARDWLSCHADDGG